MVETRDEVLARLLRTSETIAVVGCSPNPERTSHQIARFLLEQGYEVIPVHPKADEILGQKVYPSLLEIPRTKKVDIVDVFRRAEFTPPIAEAAVSIGARCLWLQQGIVSEEACAIAERGGLICVMDRCIAVTYRLLIGSAPVHPERARRFSV